MSSPSSTSSGTETTRVFSSMSPSVTTMEAAATMTSMATQFPKQSSSPSESKESSESSPSSRTDDLASGDDETASLEGKPNYCDVTSSFSTAESTSWNYSKTAPDSESVGSAAGESCDDAKGGNISSSSSSSSSQRNKKKRNRTSRACVHCRVAHAACSNERPCARCVRLDLECYDACRKRRRWTVTGEDGSNAGATASPRSSSIGDNPGLDHRTNSNSGAHYSGAGFTSATPCSTRCATTYNQPTPILPRCTTFFPPPKSCKPFCGTVCQIPTSTSPSVAATCTSNSANSSSTRSNNPSPSSQQEFPSSYSSSSSSPATATATAATNHRLPPVSCIPANYTQQNGSGEPKSPKHSDNRDSNVSPNIGGQKHFDNATKQEPPCDITVKKETTDPTKLRSQLMEEEQRLLCEMHRTLSALGNVHSQLAELDRNNS